MNFGDMQEKLWNYVGSQDAGTRPDYLRQEIKDAINASVDQLLGLAGAPYIFCLVRESTLALVNGTGTYYLDDWCIRPLSFYTSDAAAHKIKTYHFRNVDRNGLRNSNLSYSSTLGPFSAVWSPSNTDAVKSGSAASVTEGATTVTGLSGLASTDVGRMIRLNGEDMDYKITAQATTSCTIDRAHRGRLTGVGTTGVAASYSAVRWEIGPPLRCKLQFLPAPTVSYTLPYRYMARPRRLLNTSDTLEIPVEFHHLIVSGAKKILNMFREDDGGTQREMMEFEKFVKRLADYQLDDQDANDDRPNFESSFRARPSAIPRDASFRGY